MKSLFCWFGYGCYPGFKPFYFGTVQAHDWPEAENKLRELWRQTIPIDAPDFEARRGQLVIQFNDLNEELSFVHP
jgi:hypothetical protein